jgi:hypothetical protein
MSVHRVERLNTLEYLKVCCKECEQEPFWRLEFAIEISGGITLLNTSKEDGDQNTSKQYRKQNHHAEVKSHRKKMSSQFGLEIQRKELNGQNSQWRTHEVAKTIGSSKVAGWLGVG